MLILNPTQESQVELVELAPRLASLSGKRLGLYNNGKLNAARILDLIASELSEDGQFEVVIGHYHPDKLMEDGEWIDVDSCDAIILANGDCGACSSSGIANAIALEKRGIPAFLVSTPPFTQALQTMVKMRGMPQLEWGIVEHPIGSVQEPELQRRAKAAADQFRSVILGAAAGQADRERVLAGA